MTSGEIQRFLLVMDVGRGGPRSSFMSVTGF